MKKNLLSIISLRRHFKLKMHPNYKNVITSHNLYYYYYYYIDFNILLSSFNILYQYKYNLQK